MNHQDRLFELAVSTSVHAHAPYSKFRVGAALLCSNGKYYAGCNVENVSFPVGTCAEAGAIAAMVADGGEKIEEILVYADSDALITPCGACRQRIAEFASAQCKVHLANSSGIGKTLSAESLLPFGFKEF